MPAFGIEKKAYGKLASLELTPYIDNQVYAISHTMDFITIDLNILNTRNEAIKVNVAIATSDDFDLKDYIEYQVTIPANGVLVRSDIKCSPGEMIFINSDNSGTVVRVSGYEGL